MYNDLPVELLQYVFMLLSPCSDLKTVLNVCKRWREAGQSVSRLRELITHSAFNLRRPLQWISHQSNSSFKKSRYARPSKRFGSAAMFHKKSVYIFGGATKELTAFNDLWMFDLCFLEWKRIIGLGELPTPRAHAKGGFIGNILYLYGGCQSFHRSGTEYAGRIDWLTELNSFNLDTMCWSRIALREARSLVLEPPPIVAGQSGCFLPSGGTKEPSILVLFGGMSQSLGFCVNYLCIICPESGTWISPSETPDQVIGERPAGRCGHSVCSLDSNRMVVLFGNLESPLASSFDSSTQQQHYSLSSDSSDNPRFQASTQQYRGRPAGDIWILTRCQPLPGQDWFDVSWFWIKVQQKYNLYGSPPIDFYHAIAISIPCHENNDGDNNLDDDINLSIHIDKSNLLTDDISGSDVDLNNSQMNNYSKIHTVVIVSQSTQTILNEASKQRRYWQRMNCNVDVNDKSSSFINLAPTCSSPAIHATSNCNLSNKQTTSISSVDDSSSQEPDRVSQSSSFKRTNNRRARRLEVLAIQERRIFGSHRNWDPNNSCTFTNAVSANGPLYNPHQATNSSSVNGIQFPSKPLSLYSLRITELLPNIGRQFSNTNYVNNKKNNSDVKISEFLNLELIQKNVLAEWLLPKKSNYLDLLFGPQECLGFSCTFGYGCLFLFGGLSESDDLQSNNHYDHSYSHNNSTVNNNTGSGNFNSIPFLSSPSSSFCANHSSASSSNKNVDFNESCTHGRLIPRFHSPDNESYMDSVRMAQFFALRARALAGTLI